VTAAWPGEPDTALEKARKIDAAVAVPVGMGLVVPSVKILEILFTEPLAKERHAAMRKNGKAGTPSSTEH
jgi:hypothetical protein